MEDVEEQLKRPSHPLPQLNLPEMGKGTKNLFNWTRDDFRLHDYESEPPIKFAIAV